MATARLADLSVVAGLYAFVAGSLLYALIGTDRHLSVGADSASTAWSSLWPLSPSWWWLWWASSRVCCWPCPSQIAPGAPSGRATPSSAATRVPTIGSRGTSAGRRSRELKHGALLEQLGADHLFASVEDAVAGLKGRA
jgi:hypothetical protein